MAIQSISYNRKGFQIALAWPRGVQGTILYALPRGSAPISDEEILSLRDHSALDSVCGFTYRAGTGNIQYAPNAPQLSARWIDVWFCDHDAEGGVVQHRRAGSFFNGDCVVGFRFALSRVSDRCQAVNLTVQNLSGFAIEAGGIGYRVSYRVDSRCFAIPLPISPGQRIELPQFEIPLEANVEMHRFDEKYPARFVPLEK